MAHIWLSGLYHESWWTDWLLAPPFFQILCKQPNLVGQREKKCIGFLAEFFYLLQKAFLTTAFASSCDCFDKKQISWEFKDSGGIFPILIKFNQHSLDEFKRYLKVSFSCFDCYSYFFTIQDQFRNISYSVDKIYLDQIGF